MSRSFLANLRCSRCRKSYHADEVHQVCACGAPLLAEYDLEEAAESLKKSELPYREPSLWRYRELLPVRYKENIVTLGEGMTPLIPLRKTGAAIGLKNLYLKDEGVIPTGTFKARGAAVAVSRAKELGIKILATPTNGNAGGAWATYAARAGMGTYIVMPKDAPSITRNECAITGSHLYLVNGLIGDAGKIIGRAVEKYHWFDASTLKEPYRIEGKKTMGLEIVEQFGWSVPDVILYPTGGGVGIIGIYKALKELQAMGWIDQKMPRLVGVQARGCAPIVKAWRENKMFSEFWPDSKTIAFGINVPKALGDFLVLEAIYNTNGTAIAVDDNEILKAQKDLAVNEGVFACPEGASTLAAIKQLREDGWVESDDRIVLLNTGTGLKYPDTVNVNVPLLEPGDEIPSEF